MACAGRATDSQLPMGWSSLVSDREDSGVAESQDHFLLMYCRVWLLSEVAHVTWTPEAFSTPAACQGGWPVRAPGSLQLIGTAFGCPRKNFLWFLPSRRIQDPPPHLNFLSNPTAFFSPLPSDFLKTRIWILCLHSHCRVHFYLHPHPS